MTTAAEAIRKAMIALGGEADIRDVLAWTNDHYPGRWRPNTIATSMADLAYPGNASSTYSSNQRFLINVGRGRYRLRQEASVRHGAADE